ncbi:MAG TPA: DUF2335 domain-containing protein [Pirellulales bacterium]|nr:DUF2335 domain-containing protein [Pirellulales bacterium]
MDEDQPESTEYKPLTAPVDPSASEAETGAGQQSEGESDDSRSRDGSSRDSRESNKEFFAQLALRITEHSGPLPPPEVLGAYEKAIPGSGKSIIRMAVSAANHRREINLRHARFQRRVLELKGRESLLGQVFAFTLALVAIVGGIVLLFAEKPVAGLGTIITAAVALITAFIAGKLIRPADAEPAKEDRERGDRKETAPARNTTPTVSTSRQ